MSLTSSLNFALVGLDASSRRAEVVARNVANADRAGYARRSIAVSGPGLGLPGSGLAVSREVDPRLVQLRREAQAREAGTSISQDFSSRLDTVIGDPDQAGSLQDRLARFDAALVSAAADPSAQVRLTEISQSASDLVAQINEADEAIQAGRQKADADIGAAVAQLNDDLARVARLNTDILRLNAGGHDAADLLDQRGQVIDRISAQIPVRELPRDNGAVALVSDGGAILLDGRPVQLEFAARAPITPDMSIPVQLSPLSMNGRVAPTGSGNSAIGGGELAALFELRDELAPEATARLDAFAAELVSRFEGPNADPSLAAGVSGLFTDNGAAYDPMAPEGLAGRLSINEFVTPDRTDQHWRLRDGLAAAVPGDGSDASQLLRLGSRLYEVQAPVAGGLPNVPAGLLGQAATLKSLISSDRVSADTNLAMASTESEGLALQGDGGKVDIDAEMRRLVQIEQAYAANARLIQAVDEMMNRLTEI